MKHHICSDMGAGLLPGGEVIDRRGAVGEIWINGRDI